MTFFWISALAPRVASCVPDSVLYVNGTALPDVSLIVTMRRLVNHGSAPLAAGTFGVAVADMYWATCAPSLALANHSVTTSAAVVGLIRTFSRSPDHPGSIVGS